MKKILVFCFAALMAAACTEKNVSPENEDVKSGFPYTLTATFADPEIEVTPAVKANFTDPTPSDPKTAKWSVEWKVGDEIRVFNQAGADKTVIYVVKSVKDGRATFELKEGEDLTKFSNDAAVYFAAKGGIGSADAKYPFIYNFNDAGEGGINTGLPSYKSIKEASVDNDFFLAVSQATLKDGALSFQFIPVVSYIRITVPEGMTYDVGQLYFQSTVSGGVENPSGFFRVRFNLNENSIKELGRRNSGGSSNVPVWYGNGSTNVSTKPYPTFPAGVYYIPVIPKCTVKKLIVRDTQGADKCTRTFEKPDFVAGGICDFGTIPTTADPS